MFGRGRDAGFDRHHLLARARAPSAPEWETGARPRGDHRSPAWRVNVHAAQCTPSWVLAASYRHPRPRTRSSGAAPGRSAGTFDVSAATPTPARVTAGKPRVPAAVGANEPIRGIRGSTSPLNGSSRRRPRFLAPHAAGPTRVIAENGCAVGVEADVASPDGPRAISLVRARMGRRSRRVPSALRPSCRAPDRLIPSLWLPISETLPGAPGLACWPRHRTGASRCAAPHAPGAARSLQSSPSPSWAGTATASSRPHLGTRACSRSHCREGTRSACACDGRIRLPLALDRGDSRWRRGPGAR